MTLDTARAGQLLGCSAYDALALAKAGRFPGATRNNAGAFRIPLADVEALLAGGYVPPPSRRLAPIKASPAGDTTPLVSHPPPAATPPPAGPAASPREDEDIPLPPGRTVLLSLVPLKAEDPPAVRLRRLAETCRSLDLMIASVRVEPAEAA